MLRYQIPASSVSASYCPQCAPCPIPSLLCPGFILPSVYTMSHSQPPLSRLHTALSVHHVPFPASSVPASYCPQCAPCLIPSLLCPGFILPSVCTMSHSQPPLSRLHTALSVHHVPFPASSVPASYCPQCAPCPIPSLLCPGFILPSVCTMSHSQPPLSRLHTALSVHHVSFPASSVPASYCPQCTPCPIPSLLCPGFILPSVCTMSHSQPPLSRLHTALSVHHVPFPASSVPASYCPQCTPCPIPSLLCPGFILPSVYTMSHSQPPLSRLHTALSVHHVPFPASSVPASYCPQCTPCPIPSLLCPGFILPSVYTMSHSQPPLSRLHTALSVHHVPFPASSVPASYCPQCAPCPIPSLLCPGFILPSVYMYTEGRPHSYSLAASSREYIA